MTVARSGPLRPLLLRPLLLQSLLLLDSAVTAGSQPPAPSPFETVARQLQEDECPDLEPWSVDTWVVLQRHFLESHALFFGPEVERRWAALEAVLQGLGVLMGDLRVAYQCPMACTRFFRVAADYALALDQPSRSRALLQVGNIFKLQAMSRWWTHVGSKLPDGPGRRYETRMQVEYTIAVTQLHEALMAPHRPMARFSGRTAAPKVEVHSICNYKPDPTSNTGFDCPLPQMSVPNHRAYSSKFGYHYVLHTELPLPDREAHYSKMLVIHEALRSSRAPDWVFFIDCDAFFTNMEISIPDVLETYGAAGLSGPHFLVAEDPGGINTGTLLVRRSEWSIAFLERVAASQFGIAWDQSMFFWELLRPTLLTTGAVPESELAAVLGGHERRADFRLPPEVAFVHQAHLNGFVPPASRDWSAYEWQPGDFVRHFAGCPWQEKHCLGLMQETVASMGQGVAS